MPSQLLTPDVEAAGSINPADRRVHPRLSAGELRGLVTARMKYGAEVRLIDLSVGGVLVEVPGKLVADTSVVFELAGPTSTVLVPSRAVRVHSLSHMDDSGRHEGAFAFKRPLALAELLKEPASTWHKVVARCRDGRIVQGYSRDFSPSRRSLSVSPTPFAEVSRDLVIADVDAIFFVREGARSPGTANSNPTQPLGRRMAVTLSDGEVLTGTTLNYRRDGNGFFLHPAGTDILKVYVTPWAVRDPAFL